MTIGRRSLTARAPAQQTVAAFDIGIVHPPANRLPTNKGQLLIRNVVRTTAALPQGRHLRPKALRPREALHLAQGVEGRVDGHLRYTSGVRLYGLGRCHCDEDAAAGIPGSDLRPRQRRAPQASERPQELI